MVTRSEEGKLHPTRYFFNAFVGGFCDRNRNFELYQIQPEFRADKFQVNSVRMDLQIGRYYAIGSAADDFVAFSDKMAATGYNRGAYGALELFLAVGDRADVGGWIQYGEAVKGGFHLRPTMKPDLVDPTGPVGINFMGFDSAEIGHVGAYSIGYQVLGPQPPLNWIHEALRIFRKAANKEGH